jgi:dUTP pyrophosphatase
MEDQIMEEVQIKIKKLKDDAKLPYYASKGAAGMDVSALLENDVPLESGETFLVQTGLAIEIPDGYEMQVRPRSGLAIKHGVTVLNAPGTIDSDYRGELCVILINLSNTAYTLKNGERIAQLIVSPVCKAQLHLVSELSETTRGAGGFGSTGSSIFAGVK